MGLVSKSGPLIGTNMTSKLPQPPSRGFFCFKWITYSELSIQLLSLKCMIKMEKDWLYISALDNAKTVVQQL